MNLEITVDTTKEDLAEALGYTKEQWEAFNEKANTFVNDFINKAKNSPHATIENASSLTKSHMLQEAVEHFDSKEILLLAGFELFSVLEQKVQYASYQDFLETLGDLENPNPETFLSQGGDA